MNRVCCVTRCYITFFSSEKKFGSAPKNIQFADFEMRLRRKNWSQEQGDQMRF
jgi:hypothetical protein